MAVADEIPGGEVVDPGCPPPVPKKFHFIQFNIKKVMAKNLPLTIDEGVSMNMN